MQDGKLFGVCRININSRGTGCDCFSCPSNYADMVSFSSSSAVHFTLDSYFFPLTHFQSLEIKVTNCSMFTEQ